MDIYPLLDPYSLHYSSYAGDVYTLDTASIVLSGGTYNEVAISNDGDDSIEFTRGTAELDIAGGNRVLLSAVSNTILINQSLWTNSSPTFTDLTLSTPVNIYTLSHDSFAGFVAGEHYDLSSGSDATVYADTFTALGDIVSVGGNIYNSGTADLINTTATNAGIILQATNTNAADTGAYAHLIARASTALVGLIAHGDSRTLERWNVPLGGYNELLAVGGSGLIIGTFGAGAPLILGTEQIRAMKIDGSDQSIRMGLNDTNYTQFSATGAITQAGSAAASFGATTATSLVVDNITIDAAAITSDTGAISFDNENLFTTGRIYAGPGSEALPSITFEGDTNTGISWTWDDQMQFSSGGSGKMSITTAGMIAEALLTVQSGITLTGNIATGTGTGSKIGTATNQKIGFFNATPVVQQAHIADAANAAGDPPTQAEFNAFVAKFNTLLSYLDADAGLGLLAAA